MYSQLNEQVKTTISNIEHGTIRRSDRVLMVHVLEQLEFILNDEGLNVRQMDSFESLWEMIGSTNELVEDGLED